MIKFLILLLLCIPQDVVVLKDGQVTTIPIAELREREPKPVEVFIGDGVTDNSLLLSASSGDITLGKGIYAVNSNTNVSAKVTFQQGATLLPGNGARVVLSGGYSADEQQHVFDLSKGGSCFATKASPSTQYHWGAVPDADIAGTDNTKAFQACIDNAMYWGGSSTAYFAPGSFRLDGTLHVGYGDGFRKISVVGPDYSGSTEGGKTFRSCDLRFTTWENGIEVQGARGTTIANLNIGGPWYSHIRSNNMGATEKSLDPVNWIPSSAPPNVQHRYKYSTGIHIDPRSGNQPTIHYSDIAYPNYTNLTSQYKKDFSSQVQIVNCHISGFGVGVATQGCDADGNGDYTSITNGSISSCFICTAWGNTQARLMRVHGTNFSYYHTAYDTGTIGRQLGKPHLHASSQELGYGIQLGNIKNMSYGAGCLFTHCYAEVMHRLGEFSGQGLGTGGLTFETCEFQFEHTSRPVPKSILKLNEASLTVTRSSFGGQTGCPLIVEGKPGNVTFNGLIQTNTSLNWMNNTTLAKAIAHGSTNGLMFISSNGDQGPWKGQGNRSRYSLKYLNQSLDYYGYGILARSDVTRIIPFCSNFVTSTSAASHEPTMCFVGNSFTEMSEGTLSSLQHVGRKLTVTYKKAIPKAYRTNVGLATGNILLHQNSGTLFLVDSATDNTLSAEQLNQYHQGTGQPLIPIQLAGCGLFFSTPTGHYLPLYDCEMSYKAGSPTVTYTRPDGYGNFPDQFPKGAVRVGITHRVALIPIGESEILDSSDSSITMSNPARLTTTTKSGLWFVPR